MQLTEEQFNEIRNLLPKPRGNVRWGHRRVLNGILYILKHGLPLAQPACVLWAFWNTVYVQMMRWAERGVLGRRCSSVCAIGGLVASDTEIAMLDSTSVKVHADGTGSLKNGPQSIGRSRGGLTTKVHLLALNDRRAWSFSRSAGHWHDAPEGRRLLQQSGLKHPKYLIMDRAYGTRRVVQDLGATPVVPPRTTRWKPWSFDRQLYACRNEVERLFGRLKRYRRVVTRYDKLDVMFAGFIYVALIYEMIRNLV